MEKINIKSRQ